VIACQTRQARLPVQLKLVFELQTATMNCRSQQDNWRQVAILFVGRETMKGNFGALVLVLIGSVALAVNLGVLDISFVHLIRTWWPLLLIFLGLGMFFTPNDGRKKNSD